MTIQLGYWFEKIPNVTIWPRVPIWISLFYRYRTDHTCAHSSAQFSFILPVCQLNIWIFLVIQQLVSTWSMDHFTGKVINLWREQAKKIFRCKVHKSMMDIVLVHGTMMSWTDSWMWIPNVSMSKKALKRCRVVHGSMGFCWKQQWIRLIHSFITYIKIPFDFFTCWNMFKLRSATLLQWTFQTVCVGLQVSHFQVLRILSLTQYCFWLYLYSSKTRLTAVHQSPKHWILLHIYHIQGVIFIFIHLSKGLGWHSVSDLWEEAVPDQI
jgi:hypothetical protein